MANRKVCITAPARLHMGFIDLSSALDRHFGSIGVGLNEISTRLSLAAAPQLTASGPCAARAVKCVNQLCKQLGLSNALRVEIDSAIPEHVGLGSGTQLSLAIGVALSHFYDLKLSVRDIACLTDRGARSGIGIGVFEQGGFVVDGGRGPATTTPPLLSRIAVPDDWRFILVFDTRGQGLHGEQEISAFKALPAFPRSKAEQLCYLLLMQGLPAVAEADLKQFGAVITALQQAVGEHFAPVQGGVFTSTEVAAAMQWLQAQGAVAIGQTSWGPTGFCAVSSQETADRLIAGLQQQAYPHLQFAITTARNQGASISVTE